MKLTIHVAILWRQILDVLSILEVSLCERTHSHLHKMLARLVSFCRVYFKKCMAYICTALRDIFVLVLGNTCMAV